MQLGTRWDSGTPAPTSLPEEVRAAILEVEAGLPPLAEGTRPGRWTLTWLERRPVLEHDAGAIIRYRGDALVVAPDGVLPEDDEDY